MRTRPKSSDDTRLMSAPLLALVAAVAVTMSVAVTGAPAAQAAAAPVTAIHVPQLSTTGPTPPPAAGRAAASRAGAAPGEVVIPGVPAYLWRDGCGPTAVGMVVGYYDAHGWDALIPGDATTQTTAVSQVIASHGSVASPRHYEDYALPNDANKYPNPPLADKSELPVGDEHVADSLADFMHTSWSVDGLYYGWSYSDKIGPAFTGYVDAVAPQYTPTTSDYYLDDGSLNWTLVRDEIDASRPLVFLVDSDGDGATDHFVPVIGYRETYGYREYACWDTWTTSNVRWATFGAMSPSYSWGVWGATTFHLAGPVTLTAPNGGEDWTSGQVQTITWTPGIGNVKLEVSHEGGPFTTIAAATPNDGSYDWTVTGPASSQVVVRVSSLTFTGSDISDAPFTVAVPTGDTTAPTTTVAGADTLWHKAPVTLTFSAVDTGSGIMCTEYAIDPPSIDTAAWQLGDQAVVSGQGVHTVAYRSLDNAANAEAPQTCTVKIDALGPKTTAYAASVLRGHTVRLRYFVADLTPQATVTLRIKTLSGVTRRTFSLGLRATNTALGRRYDCGLARGTYRYYIYARDQAGNVQRSLGHATLRVR